MKKILFFLFAVVGIMSSAFATDLLRKAFEPSVQREGVINYGTDKTSVGRIVFGGGVEIGPDGVTAKESFFVRISKLFLRVIFLLGITMGLWHAVRLIASFGSESGLQAVGKSLGMLFLGLVLAMASVAIIYFLQSIGQSTLSDNPSSLTPSAEQEEATPSDPAPTPPPSNEPYEPDGDLIEAVCRGTATCIQFCYSNPGGTTVIDGDDEVITCPS